MVPAHAKFIKRLRNRQTLNVASSNLSWSRAVYSPCTTKLMNFSGMLFAREHDIMSMP